MLFDRAPERPGLPGDLQVEELTVFLQAVQDVYHSALLQKFLSIAGRDLDAQQFSRSRLGLIHRGIARLRLLSPTDQRCPARGVHWVCAIRMLAKREIPMNVLNDAAPIATIEQFKAALLATRDWSGISPQQLHMLQAQCRAPDSAISASQMAEQLKLKSLAATRLQYGAFARTIAERLGYAPPRKGKGAPCWWFTLSTGRGGLDHASDGQLEWIMRPELVAALRAMKWA